MLQSTNTNKSAANIADDSLTSLSNHTIHTGFTHSSQKRIAEQGGYICKNTWEYVITTLAFTTSPWCMWSFVDNKDFTLIGPNIYQYCIIYIFVGMPLVYMFVILGQYTQMGLLHLNYMCPIGHGNTYVCLILIIFYISLNTIDMADFLMYFLTTLQEKVQWMLCPSDIANQCWSDTQNCNGSCINKNVHLSAYWYWNSTYMGNLDISVNKGIEFLMPSLPRMISIAFSVVLVWFIVVFLSLILKCKIVMWLFYISFFCCVGLIFSIGGLDGSGRGLRYMFHIENVYALYSIKAWSHAVAVVLQNLCLGKACHMIFSSFTPTINYSGIRTLIHVLTNMFFHILLNMLTYMSIGAITIRAKIRFEDYMLVLHNSLYTNLELIVVPQSIGFKYAPQFWNLIYFGMNFCLLLANQILLLGVFVKCVGDSFGSLLRYKKYIYSAVCLLTVLIATLLISKGIFLLYRQIRSTMLLYIELIVMASISIVILWIYGIKRLSDDLHFITGQQPTKFWKIFWIINPVVLMMAIIRVNLYTERERNTITIIQIMFYFICTSPIPILGCYEILKYLKRRNLVGLFQPDDIWGPPDPDERIMRHLFNPRKEIKSRRRVQTCQHKCLRGSKVLKKVIQEETKARYDRTLINDVKLIYENE